MQKCHSWFPNHQERWIGKLYLKYGDADALRMVHRRKMICSEDKVGIAYWRHSMGFWRKEILRSYFYPYIQNESSHLENGKHNVFKTYLHNFNNILFLIGKYGFITRPAFAIYLEDIHILKRSLIHILKRSFSHLVINHVFSNEKYKGKQYCTQY